MSKPIYLDYNATTPLAAEALDAMTEALGDAWGNPSSNHAYGHKARAVVDTARAQVAELLGAQPDEIVFTAGGTESDNAAIVGVAEALAERGRHLVISTVEHPAVDLACAYLETRGFSVTRVPVDRRGVVPADEVIGACRNDTTLVSIMHGNNETGSIQPVREIGAAVRGRGIVFHCDAAQSVGKLPTEVDDLNVNLLTVAGHKLYGPKGVGALYIRRDTPFAGFLRGAGHERGLRAGTENVAAIAGLGAACELARKELPQRERHMREVRDRLESNLRRAIPDLVVHGEGAERLPNTCYAAFPGADALETLSHLEGVATGSGAACHSGKSVPSKVLRAMKVPNAVGRCTLRMTVGRGTSPADVDRAADLIAAAVGTARQAAV
ncbi:hypothetical protein ABI59_19755 [Acidobacteria bacterium Mor1]|nr:hypothetical protein ABI59_19755 [Acidobacteria bacterium Mor1]